MWPIELRPSRRIEAQLLTELGERTELRLPHHSIAFWPGRAWLAAAIGWVFLVTIANGTVAALFPALPMALWGYWKLIRLRVDWFVVTDMRIFRIHGVFNQRVPAMSLSRIVDFTMEQPFLGQLLGYGHFVFENAAQDQGLREIRFIAHPVMVNNTIQRLVFEAGGGPAKHKRTSDPAQPVAVPRQLESASDVAVEMDATGEIPRVD